jgi:hypothetical protein
VTAAERARAAAPEDRRAAAAVHVQLEALLQLGRRREAYALVHRVLSSDGVRAGGAPAHDAARLFARVVLGDRRIDGRGLGDRTALPLDDRTAALWPVVFVAGLDAALRAWPGPDETLVARARHAATQLEALAGEDRLNEIAWAATIVKGAIAASQDEHQETALLFTHAAELERDRTTNAGDLPLVPAVEIVAELWLRSFRYDHARRDARAALAAHPQRISPHVVLARAATRVQDASGAAEAWRHVVGLRATADAGDTIRLEAERALADGSTPPGNQ